jgi:hypothetical protein
MVGPLTPKSTRKTEALVRVPPTIASRREEDAALKEVAMLPRYRCANCILETKTTDGNTSAKTPVPRTNPNTKEAPTAPKPHTHPPHDRDGQARNPLSYFFYFIESRKREVKTRLIYEDRCDESLKN